MRILHISDTHNLHKDLRDLPEADVIVHSGDMSLASTENELFDFINWFCDLPYKHKIFIAGNHDNLLFDSNIDGLDENVYFLQNSGVTINGVKFYGVPMFMEYDITGEDKRVIAAIPSDTDVLITHQPPKGILDLDDDIHYGSEQLMQKVLEIKPKLHLFGHIHCANGIVRQHDIVFSNGSISTHRYGLTFKPRVIEI